MLILLFIKKIKAPIGDENNIALINIKTIQAFIKKIKAPIGDENGTLGYVYNPKYD